jgi:hypothetical protein
VTRAHRVSLIFSVATISFALTACGSSSAPTTTTSTSTSIATTSTTSTTTPTITTTSRQLSMSTTLIATLVADFRAFKLSHDDMLASDHLVACAACGPILLAYDAQDHRDFAIVSVSFTGTMSSIAQVSSQDGGNTGLFWSEPAGPWVVWTNNLAPLCATEFPTVVARLWKLSQPGSCPVTFKIPTS